MGMIMVQFANANKNGRCYTTQRVRTNARRRMMQLKLTTAGKILSASGNTVLFSKPYRGFTPEPNRGIWVP